LFSSSLLLFLLSLLLSLVSIPAILSIFFKVWDDLHCDNLAELYKKHKDGIVEQSLAGVAFTALLGIFNFMVVLTYTLQFSLDPAAFDGNVGRWYSCIYYGAGGDFLFSPGMLLWEFFVSMWALHCLLPDSDDENHLSAANLQNAALSWYWEKYASESEKVLSKSYAGESEVRLLYVFFLFGMMHRWNLCE
jgi:hypothetical protein